MNENIEKAKNLIKKYQLSDIRTWGLIVFCVIVLAVTWSGAKAVQLNYSLQKRAALIEQQNEVYDLENQTQKLKNQYYETEEFKELEARRVLGKASPGERVYIVPQPAATNKVKTPKELKEPVEQKNPAPKPKTQANFEDWMDFLFGRN